MATQYANGRIVTDGLILCLNAADTNSYPGSGTTWYDVAKTNNGTLTNGPTFNSGNGGSIVFDGSNDYVSCGNIMPSSAYTKIVFFKISNLANSNNLISGGSSGTHYFYPASGNYLKTGHFQGAELTSNTPISANTWYQGAVTFSTSSGFSMYQNGVNVGTDPSTSTFTGGNVVYLGCYDTSYVLSGNIALALIYNRALSASEILQNYNAQKSRFNL
jgi:hypothetical protein